MKNKLFIDDSEKSRILEMHRKAKNILLNEEIPYFPQTSIKSLDNDSKTIEDINPKKLKLGDGTNKNPAPRKDVKILQGKLIQLGCLPKGSDDGRFGNITNKALLRYQKDGTCKKESSNISKNNYDSENLLRPKNKGPILRPNQTANPEKSKGFVITFSFPTYKPKVDGDSKFDIMSAYVFKILTLSGKEIATDLYKGENPFAYDKTYGKLGHGGVATINSDGNVEVFEFGRYSGVKTKGFGTVVSKNLGKIAKIEGEKILNLSDVVNKIKSKTEGEGPRLPMDWVLSIAPNISQGIRYAKSVKEKDYSAIDFSISNDAANCGTYALEVVKASGIDIPDKCFPTPNMMTKEMRLFGIESGSV